MKKLITVFFAAAMMLGMAFIGGAVSTNNPFGAQAQVSVVRRKSTNIGRRAYRGGRWVTVRVYQGGKWVTKKVWRGAKWTGRTTRRGATTGYRKAKSGTKKVINVTKDAVD